ncbi:MAG: hypothetical protein HZB65_01240, partial [Candidatus Aenigmarchaeota archaeon]|nr:hypothetical protein [Candidatus Aenigmarchaeota archaeon]
MTYASMTDEAPIVKKTVMSKKPFVIQEQPHPAIVYKPHVEEIILGHLVDGVYYEIDHVGLKKCAVCLSKPADFVVFTNNYLGSGISSKKSYPVCSSCDTDLREEAHRRECEEQNDFLRKSFILSRKEIL